MLTLNPHFKELLGHFNSERVKYLVVGGYAVNYHGHHRNTKDIDLWILIDPDNAERVSRALQRFGFAPDSVPPATFLTRGQIHVFGREPFRVDILTDPTGIDFDACYVRRGGNGCVRIPFIALADLKANKRATGRTRDLADLEELPESPRKHPQGSFPCGSILGRRF